MRVEVYVEPGDQKDRVFDFLDSIECKVEIELVVPGEIAGIYRGYLRAFGYEESGRDTVCFHRAAR